RECGFCGSLLTGVYISTTSDPCEKIGTARFPGGGGPLARASDKLICMASAGFAMGNSFTMPLKARKLRNVRARLPLSAADPRFKLLFADHFHPHLLPLVKLAPRFSPCDDIIGFLRHA